MAIQFRWWDGQGDPEDPSVGKPGVEAYGLNVALGGKPASGFGGVSEGSSTFVINFPDGSAIWFISPGTSRVLIRSKR
jgi:hypothetical protein